jgi:protocadherin Fat 4
VNGDKYQKPEERNVTGHNENGASTSGKPMIPPPSYDGFDSSFRGSLSTLVASDDDISTHMYRQHPNGTTSPSTSTLGWDYLLNWGPNFESLIGVFKDIAELPDTVNVNGRGVMPSSLRIPASVQNPSEEYV